MGVGAAIGQGQVHLRRAADLLQLAAGQFATQAQQLAGRLGHVHIDRIELLDLRQRLALPVVHQRALGHRRATDAPADRRQHLGVAHVDARLLQRRLGLQLCRARLVVLLTADRLVGDQHLVALGQRTAGQHAGLGTLQGRLIDRRIDLVQLLASLDLAAFLEQTLLHDAVDLRTHLGHPIGRGTARQLGGQGERLGLEGHHPHLRGGASLRPGRVLFATAGQQQERRQGDKTQRRACGCAIHRKASNSCAQARE
ncbi:hypothetical protein D9M71_129370 [compost metagenome]